MAKYVPPDQSRTGQIIDILVVVVTIFVALWLPLQLGLAGAEKAIDPVENPTWEALGQNATMAATWEVLGHTPETAHDIIRNRFHYDIHFGPLALMAAVLVGYFLFLFRASAREYRDVIREKFEDRP